MISSFVSWKLQLSVTLFRIFLNFQNFLYSAPLNVPTRNAAASQMEFVSKTMEIQEGVEK